METCDDDFVAAAKDFIKRQNEAGKPFFVWLNFTHMHLYTHTKPESLGQAGRWQSPYHDTMIDHDKNVGADARSISTSSASRTTPSSCTRTDNGPHMNSWPDGAHDAVPQREEHQLGRARSACRCWCAGRARSSRASVSNEIVQHHDWLPTFLAMAGDPDVVEKLQEGLQGDGKTFKIHIDGYNLLPYLTGKEKKSPRQVFIYLSDDGDVMGLALRQLEGRVHGAALPRHAAGLGGAVHRAPGAEVFQSPHRSLRAGGSDIQHLL